MNDHEISIYHSIPTVFRYFTDTITQGIKFPNLRIIDLGGEAVTSNDLDLFKKYFDDHCVFVNGLGATELNVICQYHMSKETDLSSWLVPAGYPPEDTEIILIDNNGESVGHDCCGEIVIKSPYLSPGYWKKDNSGTFINLPDTDAILYHTGDLGRLRTDGRLEHMGRKDNQLKVRGVRIEAGEIEKRLMNFSDIKKAVVMGVDDERGEKHLVAFIVLEDNTNDEHLIAKFRGELKEILPNYMIPETFIPLDAIPLTLTGKEDRRSLKNMLLS